MLRHSLLTVAKHKRFALRAFPALLAAIIENPGLAERLLDVLKPESKSTRPGKVEEGMNWQEVYLVCFYLGLGLSVVSTLAGSALAPASAARSPASRRRTCQGQ